MDYSLKGLPAVKNYGGGKLGCHSGFERKRTGTWGWGKAKGICKPGWKLCFLPRVRSKGGMVAGCGGQWYSPVTGVL